jgi:hypothetical protein
LYGVAWNTLHDSQRRGRADDAARRGLAMTPVELTDARIACIEALAGGRVLRLREALPGEKDGAGAVESRPSEKGRGGSDDPGRTPFIGPPVVRGRWL